MTQIMPTDGGVIIISMINIVAKHIYGEEIGYNPIIESIIGVNLMSESIVKVCKKCGPLTLDRVVSYRGNHINECKKCKLEAGRAWNAKNKQKKVDYQAQYVKDNREKVNEAARLQRVRKPEQYRGYVKRYADSHRDELYNRQAKRLYGITSHEYAEMMAKQGGVCAICLHPETRKSRTEGQVCRLAVDHCHSTGTIRQLLCHSCNTGIGKFQDSIELMKAAIQYLEKHKT